MAEQSPAAVAVRAFVMLACLVAIPLVAVFGNALPELIDGAMGSWWSSDAATVAAAVDEAPLFEPLLRNSSDGPKSQDSFAPAWPPNKLAEPADTGSPVCDLDGGRVLPATYEAPIESAFNHRSGQGLLCAGEDGQMPVPTAHDQPGTASTDQFHAVYQRLKELGSTYVLLESWGDGHEQFRFYCKIAIAGNPHYTYRFEATNADPLAAMANVLRQVEVWRAGRYGN